MQWWSINLRVPGVVVLVVTALLADALWPWAFCACSDTTWTDSDAMNRKGYQARPGFTLWTLKIVQTEFIHLAPFQIKLNRNSGLHAARTRPVYLMVKGCKMWVPLLSFCVFRFLWSDWGFVWCWRRLSSGGAPAEALSGCLGPEEDWGALLCVLVLDTPNEWAVLPALAARCTKGWFLVALCGDLAGPVGRT